MVTKASITKNISSVNAVVPPDATMAENPILKEQVAIATNTANQVMSGFKTTAPISSVSQNNTSINDLDSIKQDFSNIYEQGVNKRQEFQKVANVITQKDPDSEPYGFDVSDKMSILGSALINFDLGVGDTAMRAVQLMSQFGPKIAENLVVPGGSETLQQIPIIKKLSDSAIDFGKEATNYYNREKSRSELVQNAIHSHPVIAELSNFAGNIVASTPLLEGLTALQTGSKLTNVAENAVNQAKAVIEANKGAGSFVGAIGQAIKTAAAKSIVNAKSIATPEGIARLAGQGALLSEMQFDPSDSIANTAKMGALGGAIGLGFGFGGKLLTGFASPLTSEIKQAATNFGIDIPFKPRLEQWAKYLSQTGYGKMLIDRAKQIYGTTTEMMEGITKPSNKAILDDLDTREVNINNVLQNQKLSHYEQEKYQKQLSDIQLQREQIGTVPGYSQYLFGKFKQGLNDFKQQANNLWNKVYGDLENSPTISMLNTQPLAEQISNDLKDIPRALRKNTLMGISENILASANNQVKQTFLDNGIADSNIMSEYLESYLNGSKLDSQVYKVISPYIGEIDTQLKRLNLPQGIDNSFDPIHYLSDKGSMDFKTFKLFRTLIGQKLETATNSVDKGYYKSAYATMTNDLENHVIQYGKQDTIDAFRQASALTRDKISPLRNIIDEYSTTKDKNADTFIGRFLKPDQPNNISNILKTLPKDDNTSQLAIKAANLHEAYNRANTGFGFNPIKFINEALRLGETNNVHYTQEEMKVFNGYKSLVDYVSRISPDALEEGMEKGVLPQKYAGNVFRGERNIRNLEYMGVAALGLKLGVGALLPIVFSSMAAGRLLTSSKGRQLMIKMSNFGEKMESGKVNPVVSNVIKYLGFYPSAAGIGKIETTEE